MTQGVPPVRAVQAALAPSFLFLDSSQLAPGYAAAWNGAPMGQALPPAGQENLLDRYLARLATPQNSSCEPGAQNPFCLNNLVTDQQIVSGCVPMCRTGEVETPYEERNVASHALKQDT